MFGTRTVRDQVVTWVDRAIDIQDGALRAYVAKVRAGLDTAGRDAAELDAAGRDAAGRDAAGATPDDDRRLTVALENQYLAAVSGAGAAVGGAASVPGVGTGLAVGLSVAETVAFLDATALFTLAAADLAGCAVTELRRRRALLLLVLLGDNAVRLVPAAADSTSGDPEGWGRRLAELADDAVDAINQTAETWLITRFGTRQGLLVLGRLAPFGLGAAVGAAGNALTAKGVIARVRSAFADPPAPHTPTAPQPLAVPATPGAVAIETARIDPPSGKYAGLFTLLTSHSGKTVALTLTEIESAVTGGLPQTALRNPAWWGNDPATRAPQARAWLAAGLQVSDVDLALGTVNWARVQVPASV